MNMESCDEEAINEIPPATSRAPDQAQEKEQHALEKAMKPGGKCGDAYRMNLSLRDVNNSLRTSEGWAPPRGDSGGNMATR